jgi:predicted dehydrogenase
VLKIAIVGCGKIADDHAAQIGRIKGCEIVGVCDRELLMARQLYERFPIKAYFADLTRLLDEAKPDVVHVTTPPDNHFDIAKYCLECGCHVYVEKPFTMNQGDAKTLLAFAAKKRLKITVGHDEQFRPAARRMRRLVENGFLGSGPVHMESYYGYGLGGSGYAGAFLGDKRHWIRRLPGKLLQNVISHGIARIAEFLTSESPGVIAYGFVSPLLRSMGESEIIDELRVIIHDEGRTTAYFTFSSQMRPSLHQFRIYGAKNGLALDQDNETLIQLRGSSSKDLAGKLGGPIQLAAQYLGNLRTNLGAFLARDLHTQSGMRFLVESFYRSIVEDGPVPIPPREILLTAKIMDAIFIQLEERRQDVEG